MIKGIKMSGLLLRIKNGILSTKTRPYLLLLPSALLIFCVMIYPIFYGVYISFHRYILTLGEGKSFVGLGNYRVLLSDPIFLLTLRNTLVWALLVVGSSTGLGLAVALLLNQRFRVRAFVRGSILLPWIIPGVVAATVWGLIYNGRYGALNYFLVHYMKLNSFQYFQWVGDPAITLFSIIIIQIWKATPFFALAFLSALQSVPQELYEAAQIDGASRLQKFRFITMPSIKNILFILVLLNTIWTFKAFQLVYVMSGGGPFHSSEIIGVYTWLTAFFFDRMGRAAASGVMIMIFLLVFSFVYLRLSFGKKNEGRA